MLLLGLGDVQFDSNLVTMVIGALAAVAGWFLKAKMGGGGGGGTTPPGAAETSPDLATLIKQIVTQLAADSPAPAPNVVSPTAPNVVQAVGREGPLHNVVTQFGELMKSLSEDLATLSSRPHDAPADSNYFATVQGIANKFVAIWPLLRVLAAAFGVPLPNVPFNPIQLAKVVGTVNPLDGLSPDEVKTLMDFLGTVKGLGGLSTVLAMLKAQPNTQLAA